MLVGLNMGTAKVTYVAFAIPRPGDGRGVKFLIEVPLESALQRVVEFPGRVLHGSDDQVCI